MIALAVLLALLFVADARKIRRRVASLAVLEPSDGEVSPEHAFVVAEGVALDEATRGAASEHARRRGLDVLDLVPGDLPALDALGFAFLVNPARVRADRLAPGRTARHAMLVRREVLARAGATQAADDAGAGGLDPVAFAALASRLKRFAPTSTDFAVARTLRAVREPPSRRLAVLREVAGAAGAAIVVVGQPILLGLLALAVWASPIAGAVALAAFHLQPLLALVGTPIRPRDLARATALRPLLEAVSWVSLVTGRWRPPGEDPIELRRPVYAEMLQGFPDGFFEARADRCWMCGAGELAVHLDIADLLQGKPGRFRLERCARCGHVFQNPRLSSRGLALYYRDFYDGLGERGLDAIFSYSASPYLARARLVEGVATPKAWLDVGCGHGHFCCAAREVWPEARFDGLDFGESVDEAARRGWVDRAYRGLFPAVAPTIAGAYDVVSMSHYLEHTTDPRAEIRAAAEALVPGGLLLIEVPDPDSALGRWLGRLWLPWFQPQHLHFVSVANMERLLAESGFDVVKWQRGEAHQAVDFFLAAVLLLRWLAPDARAPWRPRPSRLRLAWGRMVWTLGLPLVFAGRITDRLLAPLFRRPGLSNTYRVLARKTA